MTTSTKPCKPRPDYPLFPHANGCWAKKIRGKLHYFGPWSDPAAAEALYLKQASDLHAGRKPRAVRQEPTVDDLVNAFLAAKKALVDSAEITARTWQDYKTTGVRIIKAFGRDRLAADVYGEDFAVYRQAIAKKWGPIAVGNEIQRVRSYFKWGFEADFLAAPQRFGPGFARPSKKVLRKARAEKGVRMFEAEDIRRMLGLSPWAAAANRALSALILLGINAGFGNSDCAMLPRSAVNLETGWIDYPRPKTGVPRRAKLWPETVRALQAYLEKRPAPKREEDAGLFFITKRGHGWDKSGSGDADGDESDRGKNHANPISFEMRKLLHKLGLHRPGLGYYTARHTFRTIADESRDQAACDHIMGHARNDMASVYRERISDDRLAAVASYVHGWLFGVPTAAKPPEDAHAEDEQAEGGEQPHILRMRMA